MTTRVACFFSLFLAAGSLAAGCQGAGVSVTDPPPPHTASAADPTLAATLLTPAGLTTGRASLRASTAPDLTPPASHHVGGTVVGLVGSGLSLRLETSGSPLVVEADGPFQLPDALPSGTPYEVVIAAAPQAPEQRCTLSNGSGVMAEADVADVLVTCDAPIPKFHVGGVVSGLHGALTIANGADKIEVTDDGAFHFPEPELAGASYDVRVAAQPTGQHCVVSRGGGVMGAREVTTILVTCVDATCLNLGWKTGSADWSCPADFRLPTSADQAQIAPCIDPVDVGRFGAYAGVGVAVGGCGCEWNPDWCEEPSITTMSGALACGDYPQLHLCVAR